jgi:hypothetical protein
MSEEMSMPSVGRGEIVIYQPQAGEPILQVRLDHDIVWLDAHQMATLFGRDRTVILRHVRNIYATQELLPEATCARNAQVAGDGRVRLYRPDGAKRVADNALVAITLMIAESAPDQREILTRIIVELINDRN